MFEKAELGHAWIFQVSNFSVYTNSLALSTNGSLLFTFSRTSKFYLAEEKGEKEKKKKLMIIAQIPVPIPSSVRNSFCILLFKRIFKNWNLEFVISIQHSNF